jgi:hypothetical protein
MLAAQVQGNLMATDAGIRLEFSDGRPALTAISDVNAALADVGSHVWPLDLHHVPAEMQRLLLQPTLTTDEAERLKAHFLLPRARLLEVIMNAGRTPHVQDGGALTTVVSTHGYSYPQLYLVKQNDDYSRFDRFHVNVADDGTGVDEVLQLLSGRGIVILQRMRHATVLSLYLDRPGWLVTYNGGNPHIGSLSQAEVGTKVLVQIVGPAIWRMRYEEDTSY